MTALATMTNLPSQPAAAQRVFTDDDFVLDTVRNQHTTPRTASVRLLHVADGRTVGLCVWLDGNELGNNIGALTASAHVGNSTALLEWARSSDLVRRAVRSLR